MGYNIIIGPGSGGGGGGEVAWSEITGKPTINTTLGNPGSDANLVSEQGIRESMTENGKGGFSFVFPAPETGEVLLIADWPSPGVTTITRVTFVCASGTANFTLKVNGVAATGITNLAVSSVEDFETVDVDLAQGDAVSIEFSSPSSPVNVTISIRAEKVV